MLHAKRPPRRLLAFSAVCVFVCRRRRRRSAWQSAARDKDVNARHCLQSPPRPHETRRAFLARASAANRPLRPFGAVGSKAARRSRRPQRRPPEAMRQLRCGGCRSGTCSTTPSSLRASCRASRGNAMPYHADVQALPRCATALPRQTIPSPQQRIAVIHSVRRCAAGWLTRSGAVRRRCAAGCTPSACARA